MGFFSYVAFVNFSMFCCCIQSQVTSGVYERLQKSSKGGLTWDWSVEAKAVYGHVVGKLPINNFGVPWSHADYVYGIANIQERHWVLYQISILERKVRIYDTLSSSRPPARQKAVFGKLAFALKFICAKMDVRGEGSQVGSTKKAWSVESWPDTPQQTNSSDCGIMCLKMFECFLFGTSISDIDPHMCANFRRTYCVELFHLDNIGM